MQTIHLLFLTEAGKSEILNARCEAVDLAHGILITRTSFTGRIRHIPLSSEAMPLIRKLPHRFDVPRLFSFRGTPLTYLNYMGPAAHPVWTSRPAPCRPAARLRPFSHEHRNATLRTSFRHGPLPAGNTAPAHPFHVRYHGAPMNTVIGAHLPHPAPSP